MYGEALAAAYVAVLALIALVDVRTRRAPNRLVYPATLAGALAPLPLGLEAAREAWLGGALAFAVMMAIYLVGRGKMGAGDTKTSALAGLAVGAQGVLTMLAATFLAASAVTLVVLLLRVRDRKDSFPFTPFILGGVLAWLYIDGGYLLS